MRIKLGTPVRSAFTGLAITALSVLALPATAGTLDTVKQRGVLQCGVSEGLFGFSEKDAQGKWSGFDVDFCRAVAGANFDDPAKVAQLDLDAGAGSRAWARLRRHHLS